ncbi:MAG: Na/Pi cotransporter family protein [Burkholderiaceae bacterium]|nr:Na/Pi cotransporter family protein [Burkholderiaceae bacterium]
MYEDSLQLIPMLIGLAGGLAMFLHGMTLMSNGMRTMAGSQIKTIMARLAGNRFSALLTGAVITAVVQSSTVTSVIAIGFVSAGVLTVAQAIVVSMGAAVGSAVTTQIIAFDVSYFALVLMAVGFGLSMWKARRIVSLAGTVTMGLGVLFIGLSLMSDFMAPLRTYQPFIDLMASMTNPFLGILIGAIFTAVVQSSTATLGVVIALASQGLIPLEAGIALVFGANIGTTLTGLLATIGQPRAALHTAIGLVCFKVLLVAIWLPLMGLLEHLTRAISPVAPAGVALAQQLAFEVPRQIANVHMLVNLTTVLILLPFTKMLATLIVRVVGHGPEVSREQEIASELDPVLFRLPPVALEAARRELLLLGERVGDLLDAAVPAILAGTKAEVDQLGEAEDHIDRQHSAIVDFLEKLLEPGQSPDVSRMAIDLVEAADYLESIGDQVDREMIPLFQRHAEGGSTLSPQARKSLSAFAQAVSQELRHALRAVGGADPVLARSVLDSKAQLRALERAAIEPQVQSGQTDGPQWLLPSALERELTESLRRVYSLTRRFVCVGTGMHGSDSN